MLGLFQPRLPSSTTRAGGIAFASRPKDSPARNAQLALLAGLPCFSSLDFFQSNSLGNGSRLVWAAGRRSVVAGYVIARRIHGLRIAWDRVLMIHLRGSFLILLCARITRGGAPIFNWYHTPTEWFPIVLYAAKLLAQPRN